MRVLVDGRVDLGAGLAVRGGDLGQRGVGVGGGRGGLLEPPSSSRIRSSCPPVTARISSRSASNVIRASDTGRAAPGSSPAGVRAPGAGRVSRLWSTCRFSWSVSAR